MEFLVDRHHLQNQCYHHCRRLRPHHPQCQAPLLCSVVLTLVEVQRNKLFQQDKRHYDLDRMTAKFRILRDIYHMAQGYHVHTVHCRFPNQVIDDDRVPQCYHHCRRLRHYRPQFQAALLCSQAALLCSVELTLVEVQRNKLFQQDKRHYDLDRMIATIRILRDIYHMVQDHHVHTVHCRLMNPN